MKIKDLPTGAKVFVERHGTYHKAEVLNIVEVRQQGYGNGHKTTKRVSIKYEGRKGTWHFDTVIPGKIVDYWSWDEWDELQERNAREAEKRARESQERELRWPVVFDGIESLGIEWSRSTIFDKRGTSVAIPLDALEQLVAKALQS